MTDTILLHRIEHTDDAYMPLFEELYVQAFPEEERRDLPALRERINREIRFYAHAIVLGDRFVGLLTWWDFGTFLYGEHFATSPELRGKGLGSLAIRELQHHGDQRPVIIEVEPPTDELTRRRIGFYLRLGLSLLDTPYLQPPYRVGDAPLPLRLMLYGVLGANNLGEMIQTIHSEVYDIPIPY